MRSLLQDRFESIDRIASVGCPVLVLAGERDRLIPVEESRRLFEAAVEPKHLALIPGARHNDLALLAGPQALDEIRRFLEEAEVLPAPPVLQAEP